MPIIGHHGKKTMRATLSKTLLAPNEKGCRTLCLHLCEMPKYQVGTQKIIGSYKAFKSCQDLLKVFQWIL